MGQYRHTISNIMAMPRDVLLQKTTEVILGHDSNLLIVTNVQIIPNDSVMHFYGF